MSRCIIAGSRSIHTYAHVAEAVRRSGYVVSEVVSGHANGVDMLGERWAMVQGVPVRIFHALWGVHGKGAGFKRNEEMATYADALIAVWDGHSRGTAHMIKAMRQHGKPVSVWTLGD